MGLRRNKKKKHGTNNIAKEIDNSKAKVAPKYEARILVIHRGSVGPIVPELMKDVQTMLSPHVVRTIKVLRSTKIKDLIAASGGLHITHAVIFTRTDLGLYMKLCSLPKGPTITFSIEQYSLQRDVLGSQKRSVCVHPSVLSAPPCLMLYNIQPHSGPKHLQLVASSMLQVFSTFAPGQCSSRSIKRCCLLNYDEETQELDLRHYVIQLAAAGATKLVTKLFNNKRIPNLNKYEKIEDALENVGAASESEDEDVKLDLSQIKQETKHKPSSNITSVKMKDTGPRITMKVQKIEAGFLSGEVLYNRTQNKTEEEIKDRSYLRQQRKREKQERKRQQEANVERKKQEAIQHKERCLEGMPEDLRQKALNKLQNSSEDEEETAEAVASDDDVQYYRDAVGEDPEEDVALRMSKRKAKDSGEDRQESAKKAKTSKELELDEKRIKSKERYKMLDQRRKAKRPRAFGKRLAKKLKTKAKERSMQQRSEKENADHKEKGAPKDKGASKSKKPASKTKK